MMFITDKAFLGYGEFNNLYQILKNGGMIVVDRKAIMIKLHDKYAEISIADIKGNEFDHKSYIHNCVNKIPKKEKPKDIYTSYDVSSITETKKTEAEDVFDLGE